MANNSKKDVYSIKNDDFYSPSNIPTGTEDDIRRENQITRWFADFGYKASQAEINSMLILAGGTSQDLQRGRSLIANYVNTLRSVQEANANDPTKQVLADEKGFFNSQQTRAAKLEGDADQVYSELKSTFGQAPKLFGGLNEEDINKYLAPLRTEFDKSGANLQGAAARRGLAGSSTELNTIAENERQFRENALSLGVQTGMAEQASQRNVLQSRINQLSGMSETALGTLPGSLSRQGALAQNINAGTQNLALLKGQLPLYLQSYSAAASQVGREAPSSGGGDFFQKYIVPFIQPAATIGGAALLA